MANNANCSRNTYFDFKFGVEIELFSQDTISESKQIANLYKWLRMGRWGLIPVCPQTACGGLLFVFCWCFRWGVAFSAAPQGPLEGEPGLILMHVLDCRGMFALAGFEGVWSRGACRGMSPSFALRLGWSEE